MDMMNTESPIAREKFIPHNAVAATALRFPRLADRRATRIAIRSRRKILLIDARDVIAIEAQGNYVRLQRTSGSHLLRESISHMEQKLNGHGFVRIHRSVLVNAACVEELQPWSTGDYLLRARGRQYTVTRSYRKNMRLFAQLWIGSCDVFGD